VIYGRQTWICLSIAEVMMKKYLKMYQKLEHLSSADANVAVALASGRKGSLFVVFVEPRSVFEEGARVKGVEGSPMVFVR